MTGDSSLYLHSDFHVHTYYSPCAMRNMAPDRIVALARERGISYLGFSDHVFGFTDPAILQQVRRECAAGAASPEVLFGCEADVLSVGRTTVTQEMLDSLDYVMLAANHFNNEWVQLVDPPGSKDPAAIGKHFLNMFNYAASLDYADVIAHPFYVMPDTYPVESIYTLTETDLAKGIELLVANNIAVEMSRRAVAPEQIDFATGFYRLCKAAGVKFSIGSDAHTLEAVGRTDMLGPLIADIGLSDDDIWLPSKLRVES